MSRHRWSVSRQSGCLPTLGFLLVCVLFMATLAELPIEIGEIDNVWWLLLTAGVGGLGYLVQRRATTRAVAQMPSAEEVLQTDARPPVFYLRSFKTDAETHEERAIDNLSVLTPDMLVGRLIRYEASIEQNLAFQVSQVGPFIALGVPGLGAARFRRVERGWQDHVAHWLGRCQLIVVRDGDTKGLKWELREIQRRGLLQRLVVYFQFGGPQDRGVIEARYRQFTRWFKPVVNLELPPALNGHHFMTFQDSQPRLVGTLTDAMRDLGLPVEKSALRAILKGMMPGAMNDPRRPWMAASWLPRSIRWLLFVLSAFVLITIMTVLSMVLMAVVWPFPVSLLVLIGCGPFGGIAIGRLSSAFDLPGGWRHFMLGVGTGLWSYYLLLSIFLSGVDVAELTNAMRMPEVSLVFMGLPFVMTSVLAVVYGLSEAEHRRRLLPTAVGGAVPFSQPPE